MGTRTYVNIVRYPNRHNHILLSVIEARLLHTTTLKHITQLSDTTTKNLHVCLYDAKSSTWQCYVSQEWNWCRFCLYLTTGRPQNNTDLSACLSDLFHLAEYYKRLFLRDLVFLAVGSKPWSVL